METSKLLTELQQRGVNLTVDGDNLRYVAPKGALTDELRQAIKDHKAELLELLQADAVPPKAAATDRREASERKRKDAKIRCQRCDDCTPHTEHPCDYPESAADWLLYVCDVCGSKAYARLLELQ